MFERSWTFVALGGASASVFPVEINGPGGDDPLELIALAQGAPIANQFMFVFEGDKDAATVSGEVLSGQPFEPVVAIPMNARTHTVRVPNGTPKLTVYALTPANNPVTITLTVRSPRH